MLMDNDEKKCKEKFVFVIRLIKWEESWEGLWRYKLVQNMNLVLDQALWLKFSSNTWVSTYCVVMRIWNGSTRDGGKKYQQIKALLRYIVKLKKRKNEACIVQIRQTNIWMLLSMKWLSSSVCVYVCVFMCLCVFMWACVCVWHVEITVLYHAIDMVSYM